MKVGLLEIGSLGIRFHTGQPGIGNYVALLPPASIASSFSWTLPNGLPGSTAALQISSSGVISYNTSPGTVTSVALSVPSWLSISGSPVTTSGTLAITAASGQTANYVLASPDGTTGAVSLRALVANDIPSLTASKISNFDTQVRTSRLDQMAAPTGSVSFNSQRITSLADPTSAQDAATKAYVDAAAVGFDVKPSVRVATTATLSLTGSTSTTITKSGGLPSTIDGVTLASGDRILVKNESGSGATGALTNGIYTYTAGTTWTRSTDADTSAEVTSGLFTFVEEGTTNAASGWLLSTANPITLGTTQLTFTQFNAGQAYTAGSGLTLSGNSFSVNVDGSTIEINSNTLRVKDAGITNAKIANSTIDLTAKVTGSLPVANGGTGGTTAATARSGIGAAGVYGTTFTSSDLTANVLTVTHNLGRKVCQVVIADNNDQKILAPDNITYSSTTAMAIDLTSFNNPSAISGTWSVTVIG